MGVAWQWRMRSFAGSTLKDAEAESLGYQPVFPLLRCYPGR